MRTALVALIASLGLAACTAGDRSLRPLSATPGAGPDEFTVLPQQPLSLPEDLSTLPPPNPGAPNRTDRNPVAEGIAALGGNPSALSRGGIPAADSALVSATSRNGVDPNIRAELAAADQTFRQRRGRLSILPFVRRDRYFQAYSSQALDAFAELDRFRNAGVQVPTAPPQ